MGNVTRGYASTKDNDMRSVMDMSLSLLLIFVLCVRVCVGRQMRMR